MISVVIPYGGRCDHRARALLWVSDRYGDLGYEVRVGVGDHLAWSKGAALAEAMTRVTGDLLVISDGDVWADDLQEAIGHIDDNTQWAVPHKQVRRLNRQSTERVLDGEPPDTTMPLERSAYRGIVGGGIVVLTRALYEQVPVDPRFVGWGGEDFAWGYALHTVAGRPYRSSGPLWHLWHPTDRLDSQPYGPADNEQLCQRYRQTTGDIAAMRALIDEGQACLSESSSPPAEVTAVIPRQS